MPNDHIESGIQHKHKEACLSLKRKRFALFLVVCIQVPVIYSIFTTGIDSRLQQKWVQFADLSLTAHVSNILRNGSLFIKDWLSSCKNGSCPTNLTFTQTNHNIESNYTTQNANQTPTMVTPLLHVTTAKPQTTVAPEERTQTVQEVVREATQAVVATGTPHTNKSVAKDTYHSASSTSNNATSNSAVGRNSTGEVLPECPKEPPNLQGTLDISFSNEPASFETIATDNPLGEDGGHFKPPFCKARSKVAVIIPFRNRDHHLKYFLQFMLPTLQRQQLDFRIYIINQFGNGKFNRAKLMNIGFVEALHDYDFECFVFHDVDLILENDKCLYTCPDNPRHLSVGVDKFNYKLPYTAIFGGVTELSKSQFEKINGYSNSFWGWGGEDDDMYSRVKAKGMEIRRYSTDIARYKMISHQREKGNEANPERFKMIQKTRQTMDNDGLNNLKYKVVSRDLYPTYTNVTVDVFAPN